MNTKLKICVAVDNTASRDLPAEHGLSFLIKVNKNILLFDTGQGLLIKNNLQSLAVSPEKIDSIILSHGHYDHTGGLQYLSKKLKKDVNIYLHPAALENKFSKSTGAVRYIGMSDANKKFIKNLESNLILTSKPTELQKGVWATGEIPRVNSMENRSTNFYLDEKATDSDLIKDDQALFFNTEQGIVILAGCCHAGVANTMGYVAKLAKTDRIYGFIGGTHLGKANNKQLDFMAETLVKYKVELFAPCHCTGQIAASYLFSKRPEIFNECHAGSSFIFDI